MTPARREPAAGVASVGSDEGLERLAARWSRWRRVGDLLCGLAGLALLGAATAGWGTSDRVLWAGALAAGAGLSGVVRAARRGRWRADPLAMARHLDRVLPELEESGELLVGSPSGGGLAALQRRRAAGVLAERSPKGLVPRAPLWRGGVAVALALVLAWPVGAAAARLRRLSSAAVQVGAGSTLETASKTGPGPGGAGEGTLEPAIEVRVTPPAYTRLSPWESAVLSIEVPEGSRVEWRVSTKAARRATLLFEESEELTLDRQLEPGPGTGATIFGGSIIAGRSRLYHLRLEGARGAGFESPAARLAVVPDRPPELEILEPDRLVEVSAEALPRLTLRARARDDYGLGEVVLVATLASGSGERVEFRERRLEIARHPLPQAPGEGPAVELEATLDCRALGLSPAAELYLWLEASDERQPQPQVARSDSVIVRALGERAAAIGLGEGLPAFQLPQAFRSQRQIILDTERLLAEASRLGESETGRRAEALGFDQRALRLRYAGLLGEEFESGIAVGESDGRPGGAGGGMGDGEEGDELEEGKSFGEEPRTGDLQAALDELPDGLVHFHDSQQIATYFDDEVKEKLKGSLAEMWGAEGELRGHRPSRALPYEYRALSLLKSAQEAERVYVGKVGFAPPPLDPQRRLTGELGDAASTRRHAPDEASRPAPTALILAALRSSAGASRADLEAVLDRLIRLAAGSGEPGALGAVDLVRAWMATGRAPEGEEAELVAAILEPLLPAPAATPPRRLRADDPAYQDYLRRVADGG